MVDLSVWIEFGFGFKAKLRDADLRCADLRGADLRGANLQYANLQYANLQYANLQDANLQDADLRGANLRDADLRGANLRDADLRGANLQYANLQDADLRGAYLDMSSGIPFWCGGVKIKISRKTSLQLIYHTFNQYHDDAEILNALEPLRKFAEEFRNNHRNDSPKLIESEDKA